MTLTVWMNVVGGGGTYGPYQKYMALTLLIVAF
jgi:hypothetical protein